MLHNTANGLAFKPPNDKHWTAAMFLPGYEDKPAAARIQEWDWRAEKAKMQLIGKRPERAKIVADAVAQADTKNRFRMAQEAKSRGATAQEIRLILEA